MLYESRILVADNNLLYLISVEGDVSRSIDRLIEPCAVDRVEGQPPPDLLGSMPGTTERPTTNWLLLP